jgi:hypothetical protein
MRKPKSLPAAATRQPYGTIQNRPVANSNETLNNQYSVERGLVTWSPGHALELDLSPVIQAKKGCKLTPSETAVLDAVNALWSDGKVDHKAKGRDDRLDVGSKPILRATSPREQSSGR